MEESAPRAVPGEPHRVGQVLQNLVDNALRFTPRGGEVHVTLSPEGSSPAPRLCIRVQDTGRGIPADAIPRLFDPFYQVPRAGADQQQGSGLGLAIVAEVVRAHGGEVRVESQEGRGSTFTVLLPALAQEA